MNTQLRKNLAAVAFVACAIACGFGYGVTGGELTGWVEWGIFLVIVLVVSAFASFTVWGLSGLVRSKENRG